MCVITVIVFGFALWRPRAGILFGAILTIAYTVLLAAFISGCDAESHSCYNYQFAYDVDSNILRDAGGIPLPMLDAHGMIVRRNDINYLSTLGNKYSGILLISMLIVLLLAQLDKRRAKRIDIPAS